MVSISCRGAYVNPLTGCVTAEPHTDWLEDWWHPQLGNERIATIIMYLNDVREGGETVFPNSTAQPVSPCALAA